MKAPESKYEVGSTVFAKAIPDEALIIRRFEAKMYYCKVADHSDPADLIYFEPELMSILEKRERS